MGPPEGNGGEYSIHYSGAFAKILHQVQHRAVQQGRGKAVVSAFRRMLLRLRQDPMSFGEAAYRLPVLRLQVRTCSIKPLVVHFAVHEDKPLVFLKGVVLLPQEKP